MVVLSKTTLSNSPIYLLRPEAHFATSPGLHENNASSYSRDLIEYYADETDHEIKAFSEIIKGHWYCKVGTTDITAGISHGTEVYCNILKVSQRTRYDEANLHSALQKIDCTEELVILNSMRGQSVYIREDFVSQEIQVPVSLMRINVLFGSLTGQCGPANLRAEFYINAGMVMTMPQVLNLIVQWTTPRSINESPTGPPGRLEPPSKTSRGPSRVQILDGQLVAKPVYLYHTYKSSHICSLPCTLVIVI